MMGVYVFLTHITLYDNEVNRELLVYRLSILENKVFRNEDMIRDLKEIRNRKQELEIQNRLVFFRTWF